MCDLEKSDYMLCTNTGYLLYQHRKENDDLFKQQMMNTSKVCLRDMEKESDLFLRGSSRVAVCTPMVNSRGNSGCEPVRPCPTPVYSQYLLNEFLLVPCPKNTYKNYLVYDDHKICSKSHQVLNNWTKRKELTGYEDYIR